MTVRTRFAPSPTGYLHIGGARTALYSWLFARKHKGTFILRIEDTDLERSTSEAVDAILASMQWLGLNYDEGPFYQTKRFDRYQEIINALLAESKAYRCYCSKGRLEQLREQQLAAKEKPRYDGHCRELDLPSRDEPFVIRFRNPQYGLITFADEVRGPVTFKNSELDDLIIARSDGTPTYNFSVVVDDMDMAITHVIRGDDHINNTPRQINILKALGAPQPIYAHVPMILGPDGKRLSKRHGAVSVMQYRDEGFLPEAMLNYLVRLGWSHGDQEIFTLDEMVEHFDSAHLNKAPAAINVEKLVWLNQHYIKTRPAVEIAQELSWHLHTMEIDTTQGPELTAVVNIQVDRCKTLHEMAEKSRFLYQDIIKYNEQAVQKNVSLEIAPALQAIIASLIELADWQATYIHQVIIETAEKFNLKLGKIAQPIRIAVSGGTVSPPIDITLQLLGKTKTLRRLQNFAEHYLQVPIGQTASAV